MTLAGANAWQFRATSLGRRLKDDRHAGSAKVISVQETSTADDIEYGGVSSFYKKDEF